MQRFLSRKQTKKKKKKRSRRSESREPRPPATFPPPWTSMWRGGGGGGGGGGVRRSERCPWCWTDPGLLPLLSYLVLYELTFPLEYTHSPVAEQAATPHGCWGGLTWVSQTTLLFHGCGTQNQNFADRQHPGVRGDYPVLGVLQDPGPVRGARPDRAYVRPEAASQEWQSFQLGGQAVHSPEAGEAGGRGLQPAER